MARKTVSDMPPSDPIIDQGVPPSDDGKIPWYLVFSYGFWPIFGLIFLYYFWDGSFGWFDRGAWASLQQAANTR